jgi:hypothetical protein
MNYRDYFRSLDSEGRERHAVRAGTSVAYINIHLIPRRKIPRQKTMQALADATDGICSYSDIVDYFYCAETT